jgi:hypothetical protein
MTHTKQQLESVFSNILYQLDEYDDTLDRHGPDSYDIQEFDRGLTLLAEYYIKQGILPEKYVEHVKFPNGRVRDFNVTPKYAPYDFLSHGYFDLKDRLKNLGSEVAIHQDQLDNHSTDRLDFDV